MNFTFTILFVINVMCITKTLLEVIGDNNDSIRDEEVSFLQPTPHRKVHAHALSSMYEKVMQTYDRKFRPNYGGDPINVKLELHVLSFSSFDEGAMEFGMDFYFAQFWNDERFGIDKTHKDPIINIVGEEVDRLWLPDTVFVNSKSSKFHQVTVNNRFLSINFSNGDIIYHARITTVASCRMDLRDYPFDQQICYLAIESYGHDDAEMKFHWFDPSGHNCTKTECQNIFVYDKEMSNFDVVEARKSKNKTRYHASAFSTATAQFTFQRRTQYFLLQVYLPCILIVMVTWTTFWITPKAVPARSAICVTTILTLITMLGIVNVNMPKVSYIKALDLYLFVSFIFVFLSLLEYILVLNLANRANKKKNEKLKTKEKHNGKTIRDLRKILSNSIESTIKESFEDKNNGLYSSRNSCYYHPSSSFNNTSNPPARSRRHYSHQRFNSDNDTIVHIDTGNCRSCSAQKHYEEYNPKKNSDINWKSDTTDVIARFLFPVAFACFNVGYWTSYLSQSTNFEQMD